PESAPGLEARAPRKARKRPGLDEPGGPMGQDGIAILLLQHAQGRVEVHLHAEESGDLMGLIDPVAPRPPDIEFLKRNHIRLAGGDHLRDALRRQAAICPETAMHIVAQDTRHPRPLSSSAGPNGAGSYLFP